MKRVSITTYDVLVTNFNKTLQNEAVEKKVSKQFTQYGETKGIFVKENNQGKFAVVKYLSEPDAERAISECNGMLLDGLPILVKRMERRQNKQIGGGGGVVIGGTGSKDSAPKNQFGKNPDIVPAVEPAGSSSPGPEGEQSVPTLSTWNSRSPASVTMLVTFVETPTLYWCQDLTVSLQSEAEVIRNKLQEICPSAPKLAGRPEAAKIYGSQFSEDGEWYRCQLKQNSNNSNPDKVKIQYIDFGNCEDVIMKDMVELPGDLTCIRPHAQKVMLHNTRFVGAKEREARKYLEKLILQQPVTINPTFRLPDGSGQFAHVFIDPVGSLSQDLIEKGFATVKPSKQQQQQQQQDQAQLKEPLGSMKFHIGEGGGYAATGPKGGGGDAGGFMDNVGGFLQGGKPGGNRGFNPPAGGPGRQVLGEQDPMKTGALRFGAPNSNRGGFGPKLPDAHGQAIMGQVPPQVGPSFTDLKIDLQNKQRALEKANNELAAERMKIKNLQQEAQVQIARIEENSIHLQLKTAVNLAEKVRKLRSQFSHDQPTAVDEAIELACSEDKLTESSVTSLPPLLNTLNSYRQMQQEISPLRNKHELNNEKLEERDSLRKTLYQQITDCIAEMESMPFSERANRITRCTERLMKDYDNFMTMPVDAFADLQTTVANYQEFKANKKNDFEQIQLQTDQQQQCVQAQMTAIAQRLSLSCDGETEDYDLDIVSQLRQYCTCMQQEIAARSVEASHDGSFIASLVKSVHKDLKAEILSVNKFIRFESEFRSLKSSIEPWLEDKPAVDKLLENRQLLRSLKSKLRHRLADKHDAEENEDKEMLEEVQKEVGDIQTEIHNTLLVEEKELAELGELAESHFPELLALHPDCGLDVHLKYNGLVKANHEVNHYNLTPVPGSGGKLFFSKFAGRNIIVRECLLSDGHHLSPENFLVQAKNYTSISHPAVIHPTCVFFDKSNRHAYMCFEKGDGDILANCVEYGTISKDENHTLIKCVAEGLDALHRSKVLHGEVNPYGILRHADGAASLLPPDFSCLPADRAKNKFTSKNGLDFVAPEVVAMPATFEATGVIDMYCLGVIILYLSCPSEPVPFMPDGSLDISKLRLDMSECKLVKGLLQQSHMRPTVEEFLSKLQLAYSQRHDPSPSAVADPVSLPPTSTQLQPTTSPPTVPAMLPNFYMPDTQHPPPPVNLQQPPPPLPHPYTAVQQESTFSTPPPPPMDFSTPPPTDGLSHYSTPPPVDSFSNLNLAEPPSYVEPNGAARNPSPFSSGVAFEPSIAGFDSGSSGFLASSSRGFEEAALQQEQQEKESRGCVGQFMPAADQSFAMATPGQGQFEIGTFSIEDVNGGAGDNSKGRKITRQPSAEEFDDGNNGDDWQPDSGSNGD